MNNMQTFPERKRPRLKEYDYSQNGYYFVTICCKDMRCFFGKITHTPDSIGQGVAPAERFEWDSALSLSAYGKIAEKQLLALEKRYSFVKIDKYVIMPNHIHAIIVLDGETAGAKFSKFWHPFVCFADISPNRGITPPYTVGCDLCI